LISAMAKLSVLEHMAESRSVGSGVVNGKDHGRDFIHDLLGALSS